MPNGRSGGFAVWSSELERLLATISPATVVGRPFEAEARRRVVSAEAALRLLKELTAHKEPHEGRTVGVEEQDHAYYIAHLGGTETWVVVENDSPLFEQFREWHKRWCEDRNLRDEMSKRQDSRSPKRWWDRWFK